MLRTAVSCLTLALFSLALPPVAAQDPQPNADTLRRLADALTKRGGLENIDSALLEKAKEYLKNNPDAFSPEQMQKLREQYNANPDAFKDQLKGTGLTQEQIEQFGKQMQNNGGTGPTPMGQPFIPPDNTPPQGSPTGSKRPPSAVLPPPPPNPGVPNDGPGNQGGPRPQQGPGPRPGAEAVIPRRPDGWKPPEEKMKSNQEVAGMIQFWEKNVGPIDDTPALKQSLIDMFGNSNSDGKQSPFTGPDGKPLWDPQGSDGGKDGGQSGLQKFLQGLTGNGSGGGSGSNWWQNLKFGGNNGGSGGSGMKMGNGGGNSNFKPPSNFSPPKPPSMGGGGGGGGSLGNLGGLGVPVLILFGLVAAAVIGFLLYRYWPKLMAKGQTPQPLPGLGPWTIDPRTVRDRDSLVKAFEYLSVLVCGDGAVVWNHVTIAEAFILAVPACEPYALPLAKLYAQARYSPAREVISDADIAEARGYLCRLAGVSAT